ncbi:helix-turn-helix domain-containing protein [Aetokthonos hydrillicola]|uniref:helix-turn-helix domain-containing protein n=1 Tax=Aetokthonos hydrillicola TaxID=1550245 RepID=UPI002877D5D4|nr:RodZ domain-containing protein [Aetokthonos hydrillicola]
MVLLDKTQQEQLKEIVAQLRQIRQEKAMRIEEIAANTRIRPAFLQALDEERFEDLPEPVYVQGFIRRYGDAVGIDGSALAQRFAITFTPPELHQDQQNTDKRPNIYIPLIIPYILVLAGAIFGLFYILNPHSTVESRNQKQFSPSASKPKTLSTPLASAINTGQKSTQLFSATPTPTASPATQNASSVEVTLKLQDKSWVRIKSDGKTVFEGILNKGEQKTWTAQKDLTIRSGNAGAVLVSENKQEPKPLGAVGGVKQVTYSVKREQGAGSREQGSR